MTKSSDNSRNQPIMEDTIDRSTGMSETVAPEDPGRMREEIRQAHSDAERAEKLHGREGAKQHNFQFNSSPQESAIYLPRKN